MATKFDNLPLKGGMLRSLTIKSGESMTLDLLVPKLQDGEVVGTFAYHLVLSQIEDFQVNVTANPWLELRRHQTKRSSSLLQRVERRIRKYLPNAKRVRRAHFEMVFDHGSLDVIAQTYSLIVVADLSTPPEPE